MVNCAVPSCKNNSTNNSKKDGITFHRFPRDESRRQKWESAMDRQDWTATCASTICSEHFHTSDFYLTEGGYRRLSLDAVPAINICPFEEPLPTISQLGTDGSPTDSEEVVRLKFKVRRLEVISEQRRRKIKKMCLSKRKLNRKLHKMEKLIHHLVKVQSSGKG